MSVGAASAERPATPGSAEDRRAWTVQARWEFTLGGVMSGRLRAGIVLGVRLGTDPHWRETVTRRMLCRLDARL